MNRFDQKRLNDCLQLDYDILQTQAKIDELQLELNKLKQLQKLRGKNWKRQSHVSSN